jgi:hypothetical protein
MVPVQFMNKRLTPAVRVLLERGAAGKRVQRGDVVEGQ